MKKNHALLRSGSPKRLAGPLLAILALPGVALATNGYMPHGFGLNKQMAGAGGSALPQDTMTAYSNPAGMTRLDKRFDLELEFFNPSRSYTANDNGGPPFPSIPAGKFTSDNDWFLIPALGFNTRIDDKSVFAFTMVGHGGMNTEYNNKVFQNFAFPPNTGAYPPGTPGTVPCGPTFSCGAPVPPDAPNNLNPNGTFTNKDPVGIDLAQLLIGLTYARDFDLWGTQSFGITPLLGLQRFKARGLQPFKAMSIKPDKVTNNGYQMSYGAGVRVGWLGSFFGDRLNLGASYQSKIYMSKMNDYKGLFAEHGRFDIPAVVNAGLSVRLFGGLTLAADYKRIFYGDVKALNNDNTRNPQADPSAALGANDGLGFGWDDVNVYRIGLQWKFDKLTLRTGYSYGDEPWDNDNTLFNILAPATIKQHASAGFTYSLTPHHDISFGYTRAFENDVKGTSSFTGPQTGKVTMDQNIYDLNWTYHF